MIGETTATNEHAELATPRSRRGRGRWVIAGILLVLIAAAAAAAVSAVFNDGASGSTGSGDNTSATARASVTRRSLSTQMQFNGTLGYSGSYTVLGQAPGRLTWLPAVGQVIRDGQLLYRVDEAPVVLLYGSVPAYRGLAEGAIGVDVAQLNHDLVALGYVDRSAVSSGWDEFTVATRIGVQMLQKHLGVDQTGQLSSGVIVFLPTAARVTTLTATLGGPASGSVMTATSTARTVSVALDPSLQSEVHPGDRVTITLPDGSTTPGDVTSIGKVATVPPDNSAGEAGSSGSDSGPTLPVTIRPTHLNAAGRLDQALVEVAITDRTVHHVLTVPVNALMALAGGGYAVEAVADDGTHHLVAVTPGLFDDVAGRVQVSGSGLSAGQRVVVPGNE
jgi:hypothetical protein